MPVPIKGYEGLYELYPDGHVKSFGRAWKNQHGTLVKRKEKFLKPTVSKSKRHAYPTVRLANYGKSKDFKVHRLLAMHFIPNPENKPFINHKNGIKTDNRIENLEWCTGSENTLHAYKTGLIRKTSGFKWKGWTIAINQAPDTKYVTIAM